MGLFQTNKPKSAGKIMIPAGENLSKIVLDTLNHMSDMASQTLGPGGRAVLIERSEMGMKPIITKDGVTVIKNLGYANATQQLILESARDAALRTAEEAGDGPQPLYAKVLTPTGWKQMGDLTVGMQICGTNDTFQSILGVFEKDEREIYEVEFSDGRKVECSEHHLWEITDIFLKTKKILMVKEMVNSFVKKQANGDSKYRFYVENTSVELSENTKEMPLDPYLVGVLLGDGSLSGTGSIELSLGKKKEHIISKLKIPTGITTSVSYVADRNYFRIKLNNKTPDGFSAHDLIRSIGLLGTKSDSKFIPKSYLYSSKKSRLALLQGLIDTDGHINKRGLFEFSTVSEELKKDFIELLSGLGIPYNVKLYDRADAGRYSNTPIYRITQLKGYTYGHKIVDIRKTNKKTQMRCIRVSNENHLYITDGYIPTHNTTTSTILSAAITNYTNQVVKANPKMSPQRIVREMQELVPLLKNTVMGYCLKVEGDNFSEVLENVATLSANGDSKLAKVIIEAFDLVGDAGNMTIIEGTGTSRYYLERITGYTVDTGLEESTKKFSQGFINDKSGTMVGLEHPVFVLYDGVINDITQVLNGLEKLSLYFDETKHAYKNVVVVAHGFSDMFLADMHTNWNTPNCVKVYPLITPQSAIANWRTQFLYDLQAYTGSPVFNPLDRPFVDVDPESMVKNNLVTNFECGRFRSSVISKEDPVLIEDRVNELNLQLKSPESKYEENDLKVRIGKLTSGIARLYIYGPSQGETREKRDRAEDAWMAIRGAIKHGACPGGGYVLVRLAADLVLMADQLEGPRKLAAEILSEALLEPVHILYRNYGYTDEEMVDHRQQMLIREDETFDILEQKWVPKFNLLDSAPAVYEAIESSISIASLLGTLGGIVSFNRNQETDRYEEKLARDFNQAINGQPNE